MAKYRKEPFVFNIPANLKRSGVSFVPFAGMEINDNPLLNTQSSASDMLNMTVDDNYFLTLRPRLVEDEEYNAARRLVLRNYDNVIDVYFLKKDLYVFIARHYEDWFVVVDGEYIHHVDQLENIEFPIPNFDNYIIKEDSDVFRFTAKRGEHYSLILSWNEDDFKWELTEEEPYIPRYRGVITQSTNLLEQPIFEDLNIMTNKYRLSVLYNEDIDVNLNSFYTSAIDVDGAPYYLDVDVAGVSEEDSIRVYAKTLIFSQVNYINSLAGLVEIYNGTPYTYSMDSLYIAIDTGGPQGDHINNLNDIVGPGFTLAPGESLVLRSLYSSPIPGLTTYPSGAVEVFVNEQGKYPLRLMDMYGPAMLDCFGSYQSVPAINPIFEVPVRLIRKSNIRQGTYSKDVLEYNLPTSEWLVTSTSLTDGLGDHDMDEYVWGDDSFFGRGQLALCYESSTYSLYYDYQNVLLNIEAESLSFDVDVYRIDHITKSNTLFTTLHVGGSGDSKISRTDFKRLWNEDIVYDANSNIVYTLHYDVISNKFIRAHFDPSGGDLSIGTARGGTYAPPNSSTSAPLLLWKTRYNDMVYYIPDASAAGYHNTMDLDFDNDWLAPSPYLYRNNNYFRNYYMNGVLFTIHSGTWGAKVGTFSTGSTNYSNLGFAMTMTNLTTLETTKIVGGIHTAGATPINHTYNTGLTSKSLADSTFKIRPIAASTPQYLAIPLPPSVPTTYPYDFIKGIVHDGISYNILSSVNLEKALDNASYTETIRSFNKTTYIYKLENNEIEYDSVINMIDKIGSESSLLGVSRTIGIRQINTQLLVFAYDNNLPNLINTSIPFFYIVTNIGGAEEIIKVNDVIRDNYQVHNANITAGGKFRLIMSDDNEDTMIGMIDLEKTLIDKSVSLDVFAFAEKLKVGTTTELSNGSFTAISKKDGYYYYGIVRVNKDEIVFTYDLVNNTSNPLRLDKEIVDEHKRRYDDWRKDPSRVSNDYDLLGAVDMLDSRLYYTKYRLYLTYPGKNNYIPVINCFDAKRPIRSATAYLQQVGAIYEKNNVEYLSVEENPFVAEQYMMHTYIPRLVSVEQPAIDYIEGKTLVTFAGLTLYLSRGGLYALNFNAETPQDDQRKATLISKVINPRLLKYDLNSAILVNNDPYVLIMFPEDGETHVFAFKIMDNQWFFWKLPIEVDKVFGDNFNMRLLYGNKMATFSDEPIVIESSATEYHGNVERYMDFDRITIPWFWKSQILAMGNVTKRKQITETIFTFVNNNANVVLDEEQSFDIIERRVTKQAFGLRYLTFKDAVDIAPRVEYEESLNIINNLRKRTYLNRFNYCQLLCYNIDNGNPIQDKVRIANIVIVYKVLTGGK